MAGTLYVKLDASYPDDPKVIEAGEKAEVLYVRSLCLAKRILSDGFIADAHLPRFGLSSINQRARKLCDVDLWRRDDDRGGYWIVAWLKHNNSAAKVEEVKQKRREAGSRGGKQGRKQDANQNGKEPPKQNANHVANPEERGVEERGVEAEEPPHVPPEPQDHPADLTAVADEAGFPTAADDGKTYAATLHAWLAMQGIRITKRDKRSDAYRALLDSAAEFIGDRKNLIQTCAELLIRDLCVELTDQDLPADDLAALRRSLRNRHPGGLMHGMAEAMERCAGSGEYAGQPGALVAYGRAVAEGRGRKAAS